MRLEAAGGTWEQPFRILKDPRAEATLADLREQFTLASKVRDRISDIHRAVKQIRTVREQMDGWAQRSKGTASASQVAEMAVQLGKRLTAVGPSRTRPSVRRWSMSRSGRSTPFRAASTG